MAELRDASMTRAQHNAQVDLLIAIFAASVIIFCWLPEVARALWAAL